MIYLYSSSFQIKLFKYIIDKSIPRVNIFFMYIFIYF